MRASFTLLVAVATTATAQLPKSGHILVANQQAASATIVDLATNTITHIPVGNGPHEAAISPDGKWGFISVYGLGGAANAGNQIAVIDMAGEKGARLIEPGKDNGPQ